jgi:hypothetical protein
MKFRARSFNFVDRDLCQAKGRIHEITRKPPKRPNKETLQSHSANMIAALDYTTGARVKRPRLVKYFLPITPQRQLILLP